MNSKLRLLCLAGLVTCTGLAPAAEFADRGGAAAASPAPKRAIFAAGLVEPASEERDIAAAVTGRIERVLLDEGDAVKSGEIFAEIENADRKAQLAAAEARLKIRESELMRLKAGAREEERREAEAALREADAALRLAEKTLDRRKASAHGGSSEQLDRAHADYDAARARHELMTERLALVTAPPRAEDVAIAEANVAAARADVADLAARLELTRLRSPIDGVILKRYKLPGETVSAMPPTLVAKVGDIRQLHVRAQIDESEVGGVALGQHVSISADAFAGRRFAGKVIKVGKRLGPKNLRTDEPAERVDTKILEAIIELEGDAALPVGLRVDVSFDAVREAETQSPNASAAPRAKPPAVVVTLPDYAADLGIPLPRPGATPRDERGVEPGAPLAASSVQNAAAAPAEALPELDTPAAVAAAASPAETPVSDSGFGATTQDQFTLQFASYGTEVNARRMVEELSRLGITAGVVMSRDRGGREWYTVRSGNYRDATAAATAANGVRQARGVRAVVVHGRGPSA